MARRLIALVGTALLCACGEDGPQLRGGQYQVTVTNLEDGCVLPGWFEGDTFEATWNLQLLDPQVAVHLTWIGAEPPWGFPLDVEGYRESGDHFDVSMLTTCEACPCNDSVDFTMDGYAQEDGTLRGTIRYNVSREDSSCAPLFFCQAVQRFTSE